MSEPPPDTAGVAAPTPSTGRPSKRVAISSLIWGVYAPSFLIGISSGFILPVVPKFSADLGAGIGLVGLVIAMRSVGNMAGDLPAGVLVGRIGRKRAMMLALAGIGLSAVGAGISGSLALLILMRFATGFSMATWNLARHAYLADVVPVRQRGRALAMFGGVSRVGNFIGPIAGGFLGASVGLEWPFFAKAAIAAATFALVAVAMREPEGGVRAVSAHQMSSVGRVLARHRYDFATAGLVHVALQVVREGRQILVPLWAQEIGVGVRDLGLIFGIASAVDMTLFIPVGFVMDRWGRKWAILPSALVMSAGVALIPATHGFSSLLSVAVLMALGNGLGSGSMLTLGADLAPRSSVGEFLGVWRLIGDTGRAIGPFGIGLVGQAVTLGAASLLTACVGGVAALITLVLVRETLRGTRRE